MPRSANRTTARVAINRMVKRIVAKFQPRQVILFSSQARGGAGSDSDVDLVVVMDFEGTAFDKGLEKGGQRLEDRRSYTHLGEGLSNGYGLLSRAAI